MTGEGSQGVAGDAFGFQFSLRFGKRARGLLGARRGLVGGLLASLSRFLILVCLAAALVYGTMQAIVAAVTPQPREMTYSIPAQKLIK